MAQHGRKGLISHLKGDQKSADSNSKSNLRLVGSSDRDIEEEYPYETSDFHQCWREFLAPKFDNTSYDRDFLVFRKPVLRGCIKLNELRISGWNFAWSQDLTSERITTIESVLQKVEWDCFRVIWSESRRSLQAFDHFSKKGYPLVQRPLHPQYIADLRNGFDAYLGGLGRRGRADLRKRIRRVQAMDPHLVAVDDFSEIDGFFKIFFRRHIAYWDAKVGYSYLNDPHEQAFILNWAKALHRTRNLALYKVLLNGEVITLGMHVVFGQTYYALLTINTGLYHEYVPGIISLYLRIQHVARMGGVRLNMGPGEYYHKIKSATEMENCYELVVCNPDSWRGKAYYRWLQYKLAKVRSAT